MSDDQITKGELEAFTAVNREVAVVLSHIAESLGELASKMSKVYEAVLDDSLREDLVNTIVGSGDNKTNLNEIKKDTSSTCESIRMTKFFIGAVALAITVGTIIANLLSNVLLNGPK